jgi:hypothetical protein
MILTIKLTMLGYNYFDGVVEKKKLEEMASIKATDKASKYKAKAAQARLKFALDTLPDPLEFYSWVFHFSTFFAGPACTLKTFVTAMNGGGRVGKGGSLSFASRATTSMKKAGIGLFYLGLNILGQAYFPAKAMTTPEFLGRTSLRGVVSEGWQGADVPCAVEALAL